MQRPTDLYELIHTLTKSEKRYFRIFSSQNSLQGKNNYLKLFDILTGVTPYDKERVESAISKERFKGNIRVTRHNLYDLILKSLRAFHQGKNVDSQLKNLSENIDFLYRKGLHKQALKQLERAEIIANKYESYDLLSSLYQTKLKLSSVSSDLKSLSQSVNRSQEILFFIQCSKAIVTLESISTKFNIIYLTYGGLRSTQAKQEFDKLNQTFQKTLLEFKDEIAASFKLKYFKLGTVYSTSMLAGKYKIALKSMEERLVFFEQQEHFIGYWPERYLYTIAHIVQILNLTQEYERLDKYLLMLRSTTTDKRFNFPSLKVFASDLYFTVVANVYLRKGIFNETPSFINEFIAFLQNNKHSISTLMLTYSYTNIALVYFSTNQYDRCISFTNKVLETQFTDNTKLARFYCNIVSLLAHFELGNYQYLEYFSQNIKRTLTKKDQLYKAEGLIIKYLSKVINLPNLEHKQLFQKLYKELTQLKKDELPEYFDILRWVKSKVN